MTWLAEPAPLAARRVALGLLLAAESARARLVVEDDAEALHDFRVALRRLRSWLRAFRPETKDTLRGGTPRRLGKVADATGAQRDLEVMLAALQAAPPKSSAPLVARLRRREPAARRASERAAARFDELAPKLRSELSSWTAPVEGGSPRFGAVAALRLDELATRLAAALADARTPEDRKEAHAARIAAKRVRYLLEPIELGAAKRAVRELKSLQELLGALNDEHVLETEALRVPRGEGAALAGRSARRIAGLHRRLRSRDAATLRHRLASASEALREAANEGMEHERKFLLSRFPARARTGRKLVLDQGWLPGERIVERLRRERGARTRWLRTIKAGRGVSRIEVEEPIARELFEALWPLTEGRRVTKERYDVREGDRTWEIDRFLDRDLVLAEIELASEEESVTLPRWLATVVVREVTGEAAFINRNLAR